LLRFLLTIAVVVTLLLAVVWFAQRTLIYFPDPYVRDASSAGLVGAEQVAFDTEDGVKLGGWFVPARHAPPPLTVVVFNGNAGNRSYRGALAEALRERGYSVLLFDYRGYGGNSGSPTQSGLEADARAARAYLTRRRDVNASRLVYFGESLGAAVAVGLAAEHPPAALVLRSPFTSMADVGAVHYPILPVRLLLRDRYDSLGRIGRIAAPLLVIAGSRDSIVPLAQSRRLYDAARDPKTLVVIDGADHNDAALLIGAPMMQSIATFLDRLKISS
jgi:fermentation-respiration switch protein FrsA (DUF1100 family)